MHEYLLILSMAILFSACGIFPQVSQPSLFYEGTDGEEVPYPSKPDTFTFTSVPGAVYYEAEIGYEAPFTGVERIYPIEHSRHFTRFTIFPEERPYRIRVRAIDEAGKPGVWSLWSALIE